MSLIEHHANHSPTMPPEIAKSIVSVMAQIGTLGKDGNNTHASYKYVSVDKFFDSIGRIMAKEGLFVLVNEVSTNVDRIESVDKRGEVKIGTWLTANYELFLCHSSGSVCGPIKRVIRVQATGPQAYGSAASYVEKYFLRSLFKIPTGDHDVDGDPQEGLPAKNHAPVPSAPPPPPEAHPSQGKRLPPKNWMQETHALFQAAKTDKALNESYEKLKRVFNFTHEQEDQLSALLLEEQAKFEEHENA